jgi:hypothetical protein
MHLSIPSFLRPVHLPAAGKVGVEPESVPALQKAVEAVEGQELCKELQGVALLLQLGMVPPHEYATQRAYQEPQSG